MAAPIRWSAADLHGVLSVLPEEGASRMPEFRSRIFWDEVKRFKLQVVVLENVQLSAQPHNPVVRR